MNYKYVMVTAFLLAGYTNGLLSIIGQSQEEVEALKRLQAEAMARSKNVSRSLPEAMQKLFEDEVEFKEGEFILDGPSGRLTSKGSVREDKRRLQELYDSQLKIVLGSLGVASSKSETYTKSDIVEGYRQWVDAIRKSEASDLNAIRNDLAKKAGAAGNIDQGLLRKQENDIKAKYKNERERAQLAYELALYDLKQRLSDDSVMSMTAPVGNEELIDALMYFNLPHNFVAGQFTEAVNRKAQRLRDLQNTYGEIYGAREEFEEHQATLVQELRYQDSIRGDKIAPRRGKVKRFLHKVF